jgi:hypothetical protein
LAVANRFSVGVREHLQRLNEHWIGGQQIALKTSGGNAASMQLAATPAIGNGAETKWPDASTQTL